MANGSNNNDADSTQGDTEAAAESADKPPHVNPLSSLVKSNGILSMQFRSFSSQKTISPLNGSRPSHPPNSTAHVVSNGSVSPPGTDSPSGTASESEGWSSVPHSRLSSRAPSISGQTAKDSRDPTKRDIEVSTLKAQQPEPRNSVHRGNVPAPPSQGSADTGGQKFNLKDLLGSSPALMRRASNRSASSRRSDSERGASSIDESTASLAKKYGVCDRIAIGKGATSVVRLVHKWDRSEEKLYAVKEFRKRRKNETEKEYVKKLTAEFCISSTLHHPNIVETVDLVQDEQLRWCEVMEYCPGGDLYAAIKKGGMSTSEVECCFKQILSGVDYLHSQGVAHRDIKPENLFFDAKGFLKIGDYGASTVYRLPWETTVHLSTGLCGSEPYIAPEQFTGKPYDARLVDIWACAIVYYCMQFQELPWRVAQTSEPLYANYAQACAASKADNTAGANAPTIATLSPRNCRPVIRKMLEPDPKKRWNVKDVLDQSWLQGIEVCPTVAQPSHVHSYARTMLQLRHEKYQDPNRRE